MSQAKIKILTFTLTILLSGDLFAASFSQEQSQSHLRWNLFADRDALVVEKTADKLIIKSLDPNIISNFADKIKDTNLPSSYITSTELSQNRETSVSQLEIQLKDSEVEVFSFYTDRDRKYVIDFWSSAEEIARETRDPVRSRRTSIARTQAPLTPPQGRVNTDLLQRQEALAAEQTAAQQTPEAAERSEASDRSEAPPEQKRARVDRAEREQASPYRDFRYGASFMWPYEALAPTLSERINLSRKTPEEFYPIEDRDFEKNEKEAHLQLTINLYRRRNFGLMYKSIRLFEDKYGHGESFEVVEYLKANALLRDSLNQGVREPVKTAISMLSNLAGRTDNYEMQKGIYNYLISASLNDSDYVRALDYSKRLYVESQENFDFEESALAAESILYNLSMLKQIEDIKELTNDQNIRRMVPAQVVMGYKYYSLLELERYEEVIRDYESKKSGISRPIHDSLLFNVAEAYFQNAQYNKSIELFDEFISEYSHKDKSSDARLRMALSYELLNRDFDQVAELYRSAINRSTRQEITREARIRYAGLMSLRKKNPSDKDRELRVLLNFNSQRNGGDRELSHNNQKLLWSVRLRTLIVDEKYQEALSYLNAIPLNRLTPTERRVFLGDGAEVAYGMMLNSFKESDYGQVVKIWEIYKDEYVDKVAKDPFINFIVGNSFIKLGLYNRFDFILENFEKFRDYPPHSFPIWVEREQMSEPDAMLEELKLVKNLNLKNYDLAQKNIDRLENLDDRHKHLYYQGILSHRLKDYPRAAQALEKYLSYQSRKSVYDPNDVAEMLLAYSDSIYKTAGPERFKRIAEAVLNDVDSFAPDHEYMNQVKERISYLYIETLASQGDEGWALMEPRISNFLESYPESAYVGRVRYLLGMAFVNNQDEDQGLEVFQGLLADENISEHIREMAQSEIALIRLRNRNL